MSSSLTLSSSSDAAVPALASMVDVTCGVDFVIGSGHMTIREFLRLGRHSIVKLEQPAGADLELRAHGVGLAVGEVAVVDDNAALRVTRIAMPTGVGWE